jgi:hypothetical protein
MSVLCARVLVFLASPKLIGGGKKHAQPFKYKITSMHLKGQGEQNS